MREAVSYCRICSAGCGVRLQIDENERIVSVRGDPDNAVSRGHICFKGLQAEEAHHGPQRLLRPLRRQADGTFAQVPLDDALDDIAERLHEIIARDGAEAVAVFCGNGALFNIFAYVMQRDFLRAIGSSRFFTTITIDQPAKLVTAGRLGTWAAGYPRFEDMDVCLLFGSNPLVSHGLSGLLWTDPVKTLKRARQNGVKLIMVDPRRSETARHADLFLQPLPGQDAAIAGALIRIILSEGWQDQAFCDRFADQAQLARLRELVEPLTEERVEESAGLEHGQLRAVAEAFARDSRNGIAYSATGTAMAPFSNLADHLITCLNVICGRFLRAGEPVHMVDAFAPPMPAREMVYPAMRPWEAGGPARTRGFADFYGEQCSATLADEIATPGKGQIKALIVDGGNPLTSLPAQINAHKAFAGLELLVVIDPWMTPTARMADYVLAPRMQYERPDFPFHMFPGFALWPGAWGIFTPPVLAPPKGSELVEDWQVFWELASRLGKPIDFAGHHRLSTEHAPSHTELARAYLRDAQFSFEELACNPSGLMLDLTGQTVLPAGEDGNRFTVMPDDVAEEFAAFMASLGQRQAGFTHLLASRRIRDLFNSTGMALDSVRKRTPTNFAFLNPRDLAARSVFPGDTVELRSPHGQTLAVARPDPDVRPGVVSIAHGWGGLPGEDDPLAQGAAVNRLTDDATVYESICAMPHLSGIPVSIQRVSPVEE